MTFAHRQEGVEMTSRTKHDGRRRGVCYGLSLVTPWQVGKAVPLDASRDDWHRERSKTRSRRTAWCSRDVKKS